MNVPDTLCPLCGVDMRDPQPVQVCRNCHDVLASGAGVQVRSTGEFRLSEIMEAAAQPPVPAGPDAAAVECTWCGRSQDEVRKLLSQGSAHICDECVSLCADILHAELGPEWKR